MSRTQDSASGYGWISILLHWLTAVIVIAMWVIGTSSQAASDEDYPGLVNLHMTTGILMYALLWVRIVWRFRSGHPGPLVKQNRVFFSIGKYFHFGLLLALAAMLISGPLMVWSGGDAIEIFALAIPSPIGRIEPLQHALRFIHGTVSLVVIIGIAVHILAALKHIVVDRDGTLDKILLPHRDRA